MTCEQAIGERLATDANVIALVGSRIYTQTLPQSPDLPAIRVQFVSVVDFFHLRGGSVMERSRIQVDAIAEEGNGTDAYSQAADVAAAVHTSLNGQVFAIETLAITAAMRDGRMTQYNVDLLQQVMISQDYLVWTRRAA